MTEPVLNSLTHSSPAHCNWFVIDGDHPGALVQTQFLCGAVHGRHHRSKLRQPGGGRHDGAGHPGAEREQRQNMDLVLLGRDRDGVEFGSDQLRYAYRQGSAEGLLVKDLLEAPFRPPNPKHSIAVRAVEEPGLVSNPPTSMRAVRTLTLKQARACSTAWAAVIHNGLQPQSSPSQNRPPSEDSSAYALT